MNLRKFTLLIAMLILTLGIATIASAQEPVTIGSPVMGELNASIDTYTFDGKSGDLFVVSVESDEFDALVEVFNSVGNQVGRDDDGGEGTNSLLSYLVQDDETFTFTVGSFSGETTGAYTLNVTQSVTTVIDYDSTLTLETDGASPIFASFAGTAGDVLNIWAVSANEEDTSLNLIGSNGEEVVRDDDNGIGSNPYIRRIELPSDGLYLIRIEPWFDDELTGTIDVTIETTESLPLTDAPQAVTLGEEADVEIFTLEVSAGTVYRLSVLSDSQENDISVDVIGSDGWAVHSLDADNVTTAIMEFAPTTSGVLKVELDSFLFGETATFEISVETME